MSAVTPSSPRRACRARRISRSGSYGGGCPRCAATGRLRSCVGLATEVLSPLVAQPSVARMSPASTVEGGLDRGRPADRALPRAPRRSEDRMIFRQITHDDLGCASYLIGDEDAGVAAVVDPKRDIDEYLRLARYFGVSIEHILETHNHADHISGHGRLAVATGPPFTSTSRPPRTTSTRRSPTVGSSRWERSACALAHPRAPPRAHGIHARGHRARARAVGRADWRHAVRR
jgi:hypothetical protein